LLKVYLPDAAVRTAAQGVMSAITNTVVAEHHWSGTHVWSGRYWDLDDARGIAIYFPPRSGMWDYANYVTGGSWTFSVPVRFI
jgi:hypothetical protein